MCNAEHKYCVYKHTSPSGKVYIGITGQPLNMRWKYGDGYRGNAHFVNAIKKYKWKNFKHEVLFSGLLLEDAKTKERELIALYDSTNREKGYNKSPGGDMPGKETAEKIRKTRRKNGTNEKESKRMKVVWANPEKRALLITKMRSAPPRTAEQRKRYSEAAKGRTISEKTKRKIAETLKTKTGELSIRGKKVLQINPIDGTIIETFPTARAAAMAIGAGLNVIASTCRKEQRGRQFSHGFYWCYEDDYEVFVKTIELNPEITETGKIKRRPEESWVYGKHLSETQKEILSKTHSKKVMCIETGDVFKSLKEAAGHYGSLRSGTAISRQIRGKVKTAFGHTWKYVIKDEVAT